MTVVNVTNYLIRLFVLKLMTCKFPRIFNNWSYPDKINQRQNKQIMFVTKKEFPKANFWNEEVSSKFKEKSNGIVSTLFWSQEENVIFEQLKNAIRDNADLILTDLFPDELPNLTTNEEYKFFKERFIFSPPFYNSDLTRNETSSKNDKIIYITDKTLETGDDLRKVLDILFKSNEIKERMVFIESENEDAVKDN